MMGDPHKYPAWEPFREDGPDGDEDTLPGDPPGDRCSAGTSQPGGQDLPSLILYRGVLYMKVG